MGVGKTLKMEIVKPLNRALRPPGLGGTPSASYSVSWASSNNSVARVNQRGIVAGISEGTVTITATLTWGAHGPSTILRSRVKVGPPVSSFGGPEKMSLLEYCTGKLMVQPLDRTGQPLNDRPVAWQSSSPEVASIRPLSWSINRQHIESIGTTSSAAVDTVFFHQTALVFGGQAGHALITATCEDITKTIEVTVDESVPASLRINPSQLVLDVQHTGRAFALVLNSEGCIDPDTSISWQIADQAVAIILPATLGPQSCEVQGLKAGTTTLTATISTGLTASIEITIPAVNDIILTPSLLELDIGADQGQSIAASPISSENEPLENRTISWSTNNDCITLQPAIGYTTTATGQHAGTATVTAECEGIKRTMEVTVPSVNSISVTPTSATISLGSHVTLLATPRSSSGRALRNRALTWRKSNNIVSLQPTSGYTTTVTGNNPGDVAVTAISEGVDSPPVNIHVKTSCSSSSLSVDCRQWCGYFDEVGYCHGQPIINSLIVIQGTNIEPEFCEENLSEYFYSERQNPQLDCGFDCLAHVYFSFVGLKPGKWRVLVWFSLDPPIELIVRLNQGEGKSVYFLR